MSYLLSATSIRRPNSINERNLTQYAQQKALDGSVGRDYFGANKRVWTLEYANTNQTDYNTIKTIYTSHLTTGETKSWQITETNYSVSATQVHIDLLERDFTIKGTDYLSNFTLILTEA